MNVREFGDFQTPPELVRAILKTLGPIGRRWRRVLEPTCGRGNFIRAIIQSDDPPSEVVGIEIQDHYLNLARAITPSKRVRLCIIKDDIFRISLTKDLKWVSDGPLLVIGNPPWVTNSEIGSLSGTNLPRKTNFKGLRGIEAITGRSNFDIAEFIWLKLISDLCDEDATICLLCKTSVARNVLQYAVQVSLPISKAEMRIIDARKWFEAAVGACLFSLTVSSSSHNHQASVFSSLEASSPEKTFGFIQGRFISDIEAYQSVAFIEGSSPLEW